MTELLKPSILSEFRIPGATIITQVDVRQIAVPDLEIDQILALNTPDEILATEIFTKPTIIRPDTIPDSAALFAARDAVRNLQLVPNKTKEMYDWYHSHTQEQLAQEVEVLFQQTENHILAPNGYPYALPLDIDQRIVWMKVWDTPRRDTAKFIAQCARIFGIDSSKYLIFERPLMKNKVPMVGGSFPVYRHVHMWIRK